MQLKLNLSLNFANFLVTNNEKTFFKHLNIDLREGLILIEWYKRHHLEFKRI